MSTSFHATAWFPVQEAKRNPTDEVLWGTLADAIRRAHERVQELGCRQRVRIWSTSTASTNRHRYHYFAIQSH